MIVSRVIGGLGNQLFQYAVGKALALQHNTCLKLDRSCYSNYRVHSYGLSNFAVSPCFFQRGRLVKKMCHALTGNPLYPFKYYEEKDCRFDSAVLSLPNQTYLSGYWQSEKYFSHIRSELLNDLTLISPLSVYSQALLSQINKVKNAVSVHVRRGDYLSNPEAAKIYFQCNETYYSAAYEKMKLELENPSFFIFSDDIRWAKENLTFIESAVFVEGPEQKNYEDFHLMRSCQHHIMANSTFSWWAVWCNINEHKKVITPKEWFLVDRLPSGALLDTKDLIPESWIKI